VGTAFSKRRLLFAQWNAPRECGMDLVEVLHLQLVMWIRPVPVFGMKFINDPIKWVGRKS
jgi:hypothetical protein